MNMQSVRNSQAPSKRGGLSQSQTNMGGSQRSSTVSAPSSTGSTSSTNMPFQGPLVLTPVFQLGNQPRRNSRFMNNRPDSHDKGPMALDPDQCNPDGSLRTMHKLPGFEQSYAQAMKARYIRHSEQPDREQELSIKDIFGKTKLNEGK